MEVMCPIRDTFSHYEMAGEMVKLMLFIQQAINLASNAIGPLLPGLFL